MLSLTAVKSFPPSKVTSVDQSSDISFRNYWNVDYVPTNGHYNSNVNVSLIALTRSGEFTSEAVVVVDVDRCVKISTQNCSCSSPGIGRCDVRCTQGGLRSRPPTEDNFFQNKNYNPYTKAYKVMSIFLLLPAFSVNKSLYLFYTLKGK